MFVIKSEQLPASIKAFKGMFLANAILRDKFFVDIVVQEISLSNSVEEYNLKSFIMELDSE